MLGAALVALKLITDVTESTGALILLGIAVAVIVGVLAYRYRQR